MRLVDRPEFSKLALQALRRLANGKRAFARPIPGKDAKPTLNRARVTDARQRALAELRACGAIQRAKNGPFVTPYGLEIAKRAEAESQWSVRELKVIYDLYPVYGPRAVSYRTGRSVKGVQWKARELGLKRETGARVAAMYIDAPEGVTL